MWSLPHAILQLPSPVEKSSIYIHGSLVRGREGNMREEIGNIGAEGGDSGVRCVVCVQLTAFYLLIFLALYLLRCARRDHCK